MEGSLTMDRVEYLARIGVDAKEIESGVRMLDLLQRQHLLTVPFENLDIHWKRPIALEAEKFFAKIVSGGRGGFCYELNGLFNILLRDIGFQTRLVSARVFGGAENGYGPEFDHAAIIVTIGDLEYLVDVGFGDFTAGPLRFVADIVQNDREGDFVIKRVGDGYFEVAKRASDGWVPEYMFKSSGRDLSEFVEMCDFQQYSPQSHFTKGMVCSLLTDTGRKTLTDKKFIVTRNGEKTATEVASADEFDQILEREFGIKAVSP
jgi:N-hydroxyarylamine O-acetyltransferase